jgi:UDP-N-acetylglucosamine 2-epimerase
MKITTVIGARPQFIKAAPFSKVFRQKHTEILVHTGQHYDPNMSDIFFDELNIPKQDYNLDIDSGSHGSMTRCMLEGIETILLEHKPNAVLVVGRHEFNIGRCFSSNKTKYSCYSC